MSEDLAWFLGEEEANARELIRDRFGLDVARTYQFWEVAVARIAAGRTTAAQCAWDVEVPYGPDSIRVEVKFSQAFRCQFSHGERQVYKFAEPKGGGRVKPVDVVVFVGLDTDDSVDLWVVASREIEQSRSITLTTPRTRTGGGDRSPLAGRDYPFDQLLPAIVDAFHHQTLPVGAP